VVGERGPPVTVERKEGKRKSGKRKSGKRGNGKRDDAKPVDAQPVDAKPVDAKPAADAKPVDAKPAADDRTDVEARGLAPEPATELNSETTSERKRRLSKKDYEKELARLQMELVKLQAWVQKEGLRVVVLFEGRDAAGKGGTIKRITEPLNPRACRVVALPKPTERQQTQWYFQRYVEHLPAAGEIVLFDRSWYNRAGVERVMGFCGDAEVQEFFRSCPGLERMLVRDGIILIKYWFSVSPAEQERRFQDRLKDVTKHWKLSPMDLEARQRWIAYSQAKDAMFAFTDVKTCPWYVVEADDKRRARLNCIDHLLTMLPYDDVIPRVSELPQREGEGAYVRPPIHEQTFVPEKY